jgi:hypothetical protein
LTVPEQGSPNTPFEAATLHDCMPTHAAPTSEVLMAALHALATKVPHTPVGLP